LCSVLSVRKSGAGCTDWRRDKRNGQEGKIHAVRSRGKKWKLMWSDEFDGIKIGESKWEILGEWNADKSGWVGPYDTDYF
jgi:hypothetical protein